jgi:hypothetical protein
VVDAEEDARVAGALDDVAEDGDLLLRRRREARLPEARDPDRSEAGVLQLAEGGAFVPDDVVYCSNQKRGAIRAAASASGKGRGGDETRTKNGVLTRSTGRPGSAASTNETTSWYQPGVLSAGRSSTWTRRAAAARPLVVASGVRRGRRRRRAR